MVSPPPSQMVSEPINSMADVGATTVIQSGSEMAKQSSKQSEISAKFGGILGQTADTI